MTDREKMAREIADATCAYILSSPGIGTIENRIAREAALAAYNRGRTDMREEAVHAKAPPSDIFSYQADGYAAGWFDALKAKAAAICAIPVGEE